MALKLSASSWALWPIKDSGKFFSSRDRVYAFSPWIWMDSVWLFWPREFAISNAVPVSCPGLMILAASFPVFWNICPCNPELHVRSLTTLLERPPEEYSRMHRKTVGGRAQVSGMWVKLSWILQSSPGTSWISLRAPGQCCVEKSSPV